MLIFIWLFANKRNDCFCFIWISNYSKHNFEEIFLRVGIQLKMLPEIAIYIKRSNDLIYFYYIFYLSMWKCRALSAIFSFVFSLLHNQWVFQWHRDFLMLKLGYFINFSFPRYQPKTFLHVVSEKLRYFTIHTTMILTMIYSFEAFFLLLPIVNRKRRKYVPINQSKEIHILSIPKHVSFYFIFHFISHKIWQILRLPAELRLSCIYRTI